MNICSLNYVKPIIDVTELLRAIRSFLHFSQLSAWLSFHQGKFPVNVHYRLSIHGESFATKFDCKPEVHIFPTSRITDNLFGSVKVAYRPRTRFVPIISCVKHSKVKEEIAGSSKGCSNHVIPFKVSNKSDLVFIGGNTKQCSLTPNSNCSHPSKWKKNPGRSVLGRNSFAEQSCSKEVKQLAKEMLSLLPLTNSDNFSSNEQNASAENIHIIHSSQEKSIKRKQSKNSCDKVKYKIKRLSLNSLTFSNAFNNSKSQNLIESPTISSELSFSISHENKQHVKPEPSVVSDENLKSKNTFLEQGESSQSCDMRINNASKISKLLSKKRKFSRFHKDSEASICANTSPATPVTYQEGGRDEDSLCLPHSLKQGPHLRKTDNQMFEMGLADLKGCSNATDHKRQQSAAFTCKKLQVNSSVSRVLRDVKNTSENVSSGKQKNSVPEQEQLSPVISSKCEASNLPDSNKKCGSLPLPSSPAPLKRPLAPFSYGDINVPPEKRRALFQEASRKLNSCIPKHQNLHKGQNLLGNFEESILHGRLQPVNTVCGFTAEIGASGSFCPGHMTLPANVFFYELNAMEKGTSPYMGHISLNDIEYHVPKKGAIQVTLFNPHGTVVKVFIVNYDLSQMPPMCHTFVRQRTFYMPISAAEKDPSRKFLRYIIHLRFASSKSGKIFLHKDFKVIVIKKSDVDAASIHSQWQYELRSFIQTPSNPTYSALS